jgi:Class II flagellar assembly regulator
MRILGPNGPAATATAPAARRSAAGSFSLPEEETHTGPAGTAAVRTVGGIDALIALQGVEGVEERRRRALKRGLTALDVLDEMKLGLLSGQLDHGTLVKLKAAAAGLKDISGDPQLDRVLAEIELRVEVELAKMGPAV